MTAMIELKVWLKSCTKNPGTLGAQRFFDLAQLVRDIHLLSGDHGKPFTTATISQNPNDEASIGGQTCWPICDNPDHKERGAQTVL